MVRPKGSEGYRASERMRLQKYLARAGLASRRACETIIVEGRVSVNGEVVTALGTKVGPTDEVRVDGEVVEPLAQQMTLMLHKPAGYVTTMDDPQGRPCVAELVPVSEHPSLYPIGRLDADTTGLLLFTTDGELGHGLLHPSHHVDKTYLAMVEGAPGPGALDRLRSGVELEDGPTAPASAELLSGAAREEAAAAIGIGPQASGNGRRHGGKRSRDALASGTSYVRVRIHEGRKRQVRRMFEAIGHPVIALHRASFGPLVLGGTVRGEWRELTVDEVAALRRASGTDGSA